MFNNTTENNTFITKINVHKIQTEYSENHLAQIHVYINKQTKILIPKLYSNRHLHRLLAVFLRNPFVNRYNSCIVHDFN